jgi:hypothetical protein
MVKPMFEWDKTVLMERLRLLGAPVGFARNALKLTLPRLGSGVRIASPAPIFDLQGSDHYLTIPIKRLSPLGGKTCAGVSNPDS